MKLAKIAEQIYRGLDLREDENVAFQIWHKGDYPQLAGELKAVFQNHRGEIHVIERHEAEIKRIFSEVDHKGIGEHKNSFNILKETQNIVDIMTYSPPSIAGGLEGEGRKNFVEFMRELFPILTTEKEKFIQVKFPSEEFALESGLDYGTYEKMWWEAINVDYGGLRNRIDEKMQEVEGKKKVTILSGDDSELKLSIEDRSWYRDDGNGDYPSGELYIAPIENSAEGKFYVEKLHFEGEVITGLELIFNAGKLVGCSHEGLFEMIQSAPGDSEIIAEFGLGMNDKISAFTGYPLFDEKKLGSCHIAVGLNHFFGGQNQSPLHMDFVSQSCRVIIE